MPTVLTRWIRRTFRPDTLPRRPIRREPLRLEDLEPRDVPAVYSVTSTADSGAGTLRDALTQSNTSAGVLDTIAFNLPAGSRTITPLTALPAVADPVVIDGTTQPGYSGAPLVEIHGNNGGFDGLSITAGGSTVRGLSISGFGTTNFLAASTAGVRLAGPGNVVEGNWIGLGLDGAVSANTNGVWILSSGNRVGGATPAARNVISGNNDGVRVGDTSGPPASGNEILGNYIGTDPTGANIGSGVTFLGNGFTGIVLVNANNTVIGRPGAGNVISGGNFDGAIEVIGTSNGTVIQANSLGLAADGVTVLGNSGPGVAFGDDFLGGTLVANRVGGSGIGEGNRIAGNSVGVYVRNDSAGGFGQSVRLTRGVSVLGNSIYGNAGGGILLGTQNSFGPASGLPPANDAGDADTGANGLQNYPVITAVTPGASDTTVAGTLNSLPNTVYRLEFFSNTALGAGGYGEGRTFLGAASVTTDGSGNASFSVVLPGVVPVTLSVAATATAPDGSTSSFSLASQGVLVTAPAVSSGTTEAGGTIVLTVSLLSAPTANVTVTPTSSDTTEGTVGGPLTFTPANWATPQTVTITGVDDAISDGFVAYSVSFAVVSTDARYQAASVPAYSTSNADNETIVVSNPAAGAFPGPAGFVQTSEAGTTGSFALALGRAPTANVTVTLAGLDATEHTLSASSLTFTPANWNVPQTVTVTGVDDAIADGFVSYNLTLTGASADTGFNGATGDPIFLANGDDDLIVLSAPTVTVTEGSTATFTVRLAAAPTDPVTVTLPFLGATFSPQALTFTAANFATPQTVTVTAPENPFAGGAVTTQGTLSSSSASNVSAASAAFTASEPLTLTVLDNDPGIVAVAAGPPGAAAVTTEGGGTAQILVSLTTQPTADVTMSVASSDTTEGTAAPTSLTFTMANWNVPQTVTVTGVDDALTDGDIAYGLQLGPATSADANYSGKNGFASVTNQDNEPGVRYGGATFLSTTEGNVSQPLNFTVVLRSAPTANVTVPIASSDTTEGTVSVASLTFTPANWNVPQTVGVLGVDDALADGTVPYVIVVGPLLSADGVYNNLDPADLSASNFDNDGPVPAVVVSAMSGQTTEGGGTFSFQVSLTTRIVAGNPVPPSGNVTVPVLSSNTAEGTVSVTLLTFTPANYNVPQAVTVTGVNDAVADGNTYYTVLVGPTTSPDFNFNNLSASTVVVLNIDNEAGILVAPTALTTTESGGTATFTVVLNAAPTADVTIGLTSSNTAEGTASPASLTFTSANWNIPQTVTVTGVDDALTDGNVLYSIVTAAAVSADANYNGLNAADVSVTNLDNDVPSVSIGDVAQSEGTGGATAFTFTLTLSAPSAQTVTVRVNTADGTATAPGDYQSIVNGTATFAPGQLTATVTIQVVTDGTDENDQTFTVNLDQPTGATVADGQAVGTIQDDDPAPSVAFALTTSSASEGVTPASLAVVLSAMSEKTVTVNYAVTGGTAGGLDFSLLGTGTLTFAPGTTTQSVQLAIVDDAAIEPNETVAVTLSAPTNATLGVQSGHTYTIIDNDAIAVVSLTADDPSAGERGAEQTADPGRFVVTRTGNLSAMLTINYVLTGTATNGGDYQPLSGSVTFAAGSATAVIDVNVANDSLVEPTETVTITLASGAGFALAGSATATVSIADNDAAVAHRFATGTASGGLISVYDSGAPVATAVAPYGNFAGGVAVAVGDVNGDGVGDIATVVASGGPLLVKVFDGVTGAERLSFNPLPGYLGGGSIALADLDGDGRAEVVIGLSQDTPGVGVFDGLTGGLRFAFLAYAGAPVGVHVAAADLDGDGKAEIITSPTALAPLINVYNGNGTLLRSFLAFDPAIAGIGVTVTAGDLDGDGRAEIIAGASAFGANFVLVFNGDTSLRTAIQLPAANPTSTIGKFGPPVATVDLNGDGAEELLVTVGAELAGFDGRSLSLLGAFNPYPGFSGGIYID